MNAETEWIQVHFRKVSGKTQFPFQGLIYRHRYELKIGDQPSVIVDDKQLPLRVGGEHPSTDYQMCCSIADRMFNAGDLDGWVAYPQGARVTDP